MKFSKFEQKLTTNVISNPSSNRATEYNAFAYVTRKLNHANKSNVAADRISALHCNLKLCSALVDDLQQDSNQLPSALRAQLLSVFIYAIKFSHQSMTDKSRLDPIIEINTTIMRGLRES